MRLRTRAAGVYLRSKSGMRRRCVCRLLKGQSDAPDFWDRGSARTPGASRLRIRVTLGRRIAQTQMSKLRPERRSLPGLRGHSRMPAMSRAPTTSGARAGRAIPARRRCSRGAPRARVRAVLALSPPGLRMVQGSGDHNRASAARRASASSRDAELGRRAHGRRDQRDAALPVALLRAGLALAASFRSRWPRTR